MKKGEDRAGATLSAEWVVPVEGGPGVVHGHAESGMEHRKPTFLEKGMKVFLPPVATPFSRAPDVTECFPTRCQALPGCNSKCPGNLGIYRGR